MTPPPPHDVIHQCTHIGMTYQVLFILASTAFLDKGADLEF